MERKLICPECHNEDHKAGARFCWVCGHGFSQDEQPTETAIMQKAIETYGEVHQMLIAIEEMAELIKELCKRYRGFDNLESIVEELADVGIVTDEMKLAFNCRNEAQSVREAKIRRLRSRIERTLAGEGDDTGE